MGGFFFGGGGAIKGATSQEDDRNETLHIIIHNYVPYILEVYNLPLLAM